MSRKFKHPIEVAPIDTITRKAFRLLRHIKSVTFTMVNEGYLTARITDIMIEEEDGFYFLFARGNPFFKQLNENLRIAICTPC